MQSVHSSTLRGSPMQLAARQAFRENMEKKLAKKPWIFEQRASFPPNPVFFQLSIIFVSAAHTLICASWAPPVWKR